MLSSQPYRGTRDFYPEKMAKRNYVFDTWKKALQKSGFVEYDTSIIENAELYIQKSGDELGGEQLYSFHDKGDRHIALRPEMTPTLARIVANKMGELRFPLRWFSIPRCFRYERPQKGRLREFFQLNYDIIGVEPGGADLEILMATINIFKEFGATKDQYKIIFNHRKVLDNWIEANGMESKKKLIYAVLDNWFKLTLDQNKEKLSTELNNTEIENIIKLTKKEGPQWDQYLEIANQTPELKLILKTTKELDDVDIEFSPTIIRGLAYYTGLVFESFDKNPDNNRAMCGGGRYDDLLSLFGKEAKSVGVGMGDVTWEEFLTNWDLWPKDIINKENDKVGLMPFSLEEVATMQTETIPELEKQGKKYEFDYDFDRSENKRWKELKKRGCDEIIKL